MITIIRWWIYKAKVIKLKLGLITVAEEFLKEFTDKDSEAYKTFVSELTRLAREDNKSDKKAAGN